MFQADRSCNDTIAAGYAIATNHSNGNIHTEVQVASRNKCSKQSRFCIMLYKDPSSAVVPPCEAAAKNKYIHSISCSVLNVPIMYKINILRQHISKYPRHFIRICDEPGS